MQSVADLGGREWESEGEAIGRLAGSDRTGLPIQAQGSWYAVQTRSRHEKKVATRLNISGIHTYLPLVSQVHRWSDRHKRIEVPLFPGYLFLRTCDYTETSMRVARTPGVVTMVGAGLQGASVPNTEIDAIQKVLRQEFPYVIHPFVKIGQRVRIRGGALDGIEGILLARKGETSLVISVQMIQRSLAVRIEGFDVEPV